MISLLILIGFTIASWLCGCGSVVDGDYKPFIAERYHPFASVEEHGAYVTSSMSGFDECTECHGDDLKGVALTHGKKDRSCYGCHTGKEHFVPFADTSREHASYLQEHNWNLSHCYKCHSNSSSDNILDFGGSCSNEACHSSSELGPQACNNCHGRRSADPADPLGWAPPPDLEDNDEVIDPGIGMHASHLRAVSGKTKPVNCKTCHVVPSSWNSRSHIEDESPGRAEVIFSFPARKGSIIPVYNPENNTCLSTYCHGGKTAVWTRAGDWTDCTSCHGIPPGGIHYNWHNIENQCHWCHSAVIDENRDIIAPQLHINGVINRN